MSDSLGEKIFYRINYVILLLVGLSCMLPLINILATSLSDNASVASGHVFLWPKGFIYDSYKIFFSNSRALSAIKNSVIITSVSIVLNVSCTILASYPLSRKYFIGRRYVTLAVVFTMIFGGGMIPNYLLLRNLGFINHYTALWIPGLVSTYNMLVMKSFFENIPEELMESARIDGCGEFRILLQIVLPLSTAVIATITLFSAVGAWNNFSGVLMYITDSKKHNLPVMIQQMLANLRFMQEISDAERQMAQESITPESVRAAGVIILILPMLIVYPFLQKYFVKGVMIGSIKG